MSYGCSARVTYERGMPRRYHAGGSPARLQRAAGGVRIASLPVGPNVGNLTDNSLYLALRNGLVGGTTDGVQ
jgi:hypothetical protein